MRREPYGGRGCRAPVRASPISTGEPGWNCMDQAVSQLEKGADDRFPVRRSGKYLRPDNSRMLLRPFLPGGDRRVREIIQRILKLSPSEAEGGLQNVLRCLSHEHAGIEAVFFNRYQQLAHLLPPATVPSPLQSLLISAYFMSEYSLQSAALFNPSIVPHPNQEDVPAGALRFVMSLRATGEGHLSSIEFREGLVSVDGDLAFGPVSTSAISPEVRYPRCRKADFMATLLEMGVDEPFVAAAFGNFAPTFDPGDLETFLRHPERWPSSTTGEHGQQSVRDAVRWAAHCDYVVEFPRSLGLSERVIFPVSPSEQGGIEDARFVRFREDDGSHRYYA